MPGIVNAGIPQDDRALEVGSWHIARLMRRKKFDTPEQAQAHFEALLREHGGRIPEKPAARPEDRAQLTMYRAFAESAPRKRVAMAREALRLSSLCADAYVLLAEDEAGTPAERVALLREGVLAGERLLGERFIKKNLGDLWGHVQARPFLRAQLGLAEALWENGMPVESLTEYRVLFELDRGDHQGARYTLAPLLVGAGMNAEALELMDRREFAEDADPGWLYTRALLTFSMMGDIHAARVDLEKALDACREAGLLIAGFDNLPEPSSKEAAERAAEADEVAGELRPYWGVVKGAMPWLQAVLQGSR